MTYRASINPFYAARQLRVVAVPQPIVKVTIGNATLYRADCFDILPQLSGIGAVITDPPFCIGFKYRRPQRALGGVVGALAGFLMGLGPVARRIG